MGERPGRSQTPGPGGAGYGTSGNREGGVMASQGKAGQLLTVGAVADRMSTSVRFVRRLIAERRIEFVKVGRHVRISEIALAQFIEAGRVQPMTAADVRSSMRGVA